MMRRCSSQTLTCVSSSKWDGTGAAGNSVPRQDDPAGATTIDRWPACTNASSIKARMCSAPPGVLGETVASGNPTLRTVIGTRGDRNVPVHGLLVHANVLPSLATSNIRTTTFLHDMAG